MYYIMGSLSIYIYCSNFIQSITTVYHSVTSAVLHCSVAWETFNPQSTNLPDKRNSTIGWCRSNSPVFSQILTKQTATIHPNMLSTSCESHLNHHPMIRNDAPEWLADSLQPFPADVRDMTGLSGTNGYNGWNPRVDRITPHDFEMAILTPISGQKKPPTFGWNPEQFWMWKIPKEELELHISLYPQRCWLHTIFCFWISTNSREFEASLMSPFLMHRSSQSH